MKGRSLILIFLFLSLIIIVPVSADEGVFSWSGTDDGHYDIAASGIDGGDSWTITQIYIDDAGALRYLDYVMVRCPITANTVIPSENSYWVPVEFKIGAVVVGTGTYGYLKNADDTVTIAAFMNDDYDTGDFSGIQTVSIVGSIPAIRWNVVGTGNTYIKWGPGQDMAYLAYNSNRVVDSGSGNMLFTSKAAYTSFNEYQYEITDSYLYLNLNRTGNNELQVIVDNGYEELINETSLQDDDLVIYDTDIDNGTWSIYAINYFGDYDTHIINFVVAATAEIEFNQTSYVDPENIVVSGEITNMDNDNYVYLIEMTSTIDGDVSSSFFEASGNWNVSPYITFCCGAVMFDFYSDGYDLPVWIQSNLWTKNKNTGVWTKLANTPAVIYHEAVPEAGKVWTDKESYNTTEIVTIFTDTADGGYLMIDKRNDPLYDSYTIYSGLSHVKFSLQTSHVGTWDVYLYENSIMTNSTIFTVLADNDTAYFSWWEDVQKGEAAYYDYVATSSNSVITIYDGVGKKQYSFNATPGYNEGQISTMPGKAGNWTGSLYDGGVYYNSSLEVYASESWIRFVDDSYYLGDTIEIEYFIVEDWCKIRLKDGLCQYGGRSTILTWMPGSFHTGQRGTLEFTLSDDNEFGLQIESNLESGYYLPGEWRVQALFETETGYAFVDDTTYVHGTAKEDGDDPAAVSNEMIGIFFSPQGIFLMFVVIITVMGLAVTKQPAGGAVCAVVGVGFGRFFNVLPTWMLLLTIIALVAFAGVSTAIYIKGK